MDTANHGALTPKEHTRTTDAEDAASSGEARRGRWDAVSPILHSRQFLAFAKHRNLQEGSCSFLQAPGCDQICSRPRRTAMVTAWVRSLA